MKVWITKYALTRGIFEAEVETCFDINPSMVCCGNNFFHKPDWHETLADAQDRVDAVVVAKKKSLEKAIAKLAKVSFEPKSWPGRG